MDDAVQVVIRFNEALNAGDVDGMLACLTPDSVFENTDPPPDGTRINGLAAQRVFWQAFFQSASQQQIEVEEIFAAGERCVMRWIYHWVDPTGQPGHVRGVDVYRVVNGKIAEKFSYVKG